MFFIAKSVNSFSDQVGCNVSCLYLISYYEGIPAHVDPSLKQFDGHVAVVNVLHAGT